MKRTHILTAIIFISTLIVGSIGFHYGAYAKKNKTAQSLFLEPSNTQDRIALNETKKAGTVALALSFLNEDLNLPKKIKIVMGAEDGPLYDPELRQIDIPYSFITEMTEYYEENLNGNENSEDQFSASQGAQDILLHTLFHEIGHALIDILSLPITGKEEDAVDTLATLLLIEFFEDGEDIAFSAAEAFYFEDADINEYEESDFWGEHSLDIQRYYETLCLIYGSNPEDNKEIGEELSDRAEMCAEDYDKKYDSWMSLLEPHFNPK